LGTDDNAVVILQVGRLAPLKGQTLCLDALALLADVPGWTCWQVGGVQRPGEQRHLKELKVKAARNGIANRVRFVGERTDVPRLMFAADIYCQPNLQPDSFGITFIEALQAGLPVVTTGMGGALEIVNTGCGILVPPGDSPTLAAALRKLLFDSGLRSRLGGSGPDRARHLCDPRRQVTCLFDFLVHTCKRKQAA
jgi:glycosyltransferase involved in cell wall biosynthesis